jgi:hypothetical protein
MDYLNITEEGFYILLFSYSLFLVAWAWLILEMWSAPHQPDRECDCQNCEAWRNRGW